MGKLMFMVTLMCLIPVNGERIIKLEKSNQRWCCKLAGIFYYGYRIGNFGQLVTEEAGLALTIQDALGGFAGNMSVYMICLIFTLIGLALTNCITNIVAMQLIIPLIAIFMVNKGVNPAFVIGLSGIVLDHGLVLPSGSPLGAYIHGNSEWMTSKQCYLYATCAAICLALSIALIGLPLALSFS